MNIPSSDRKPFDIAVVGGGIAGLTLTIGLLTNNVPVTLYEAAPQFGEIGAGVSFGPNATRAMALIDPRIKEGFDRRATYNQWESKRNFWFDFRYGEEKRGFKEEESESRVGKLIHQLKCPTGQASVHRAHFLDEMVKLVPDGVAKFNKRLTDARDEGEKGVVLKFTDGSEARHTAVVACDGIKSRMRQIVLGQDHPTAQAVFSGKYAYRGLIPMEQAAELLGDELAKNSQMYLGNGGHVLTFAIEKGKTMNVVAFTSKDTWENKDWVVGMKKEDMFADFADFGDHVKRILSLMQKSDCWALFDHPPAPTYYKGRLCLLGDSAHASTPHCGAGAGMACEDSYVLSNLLGQIDDAKDIEAAFEAYDGLRRPRSQRLVKHSREQGQLYEFQLEEIGDDEKKLEESLSSRMGWIWDEDLQEELERAKRVLQQSRASL